jgi:hypothetical protein
LGYRPVAWVNIILCSVTVITRNYQSPFKGFRQI